MQIELSNKEFRRLLDLVYMGNWVLNSTRGEDRFQDYDDLESKLFWSVPAQRYGRPGGGLGGGSRPVAGLCRGRDS